MKKEPPSAVWSPTAEDLSPWVRLRTAIATRRDTPVRRTNFISPGVAAQDALAVFAVDDQPYTDELSEPTVGDMDHEKNELPDEILRDEQDGEITIEPSSGEKNVIATGADAGVGGDADEEVDDDLNAAHRDDANPV